MQTSQMRWRSNAVVLKPWFALCVLGMLGCFSVMMAQGQPVREAWLRRYHFGVSETGAGEPSAKIVMDSGGNVIVAADFNRPLGYWDMLILKYSADGAPVWTNRYQGITTSRDQVTGLAVDGQGSVFVTGYSSNVLGRVEFVTVGYAAAGVPLWTNRYSGAYQKSYADAVAVDHNGNVFVTGHSAEHEAYDYLTVAYSGAGVPLWTNRFDGVGPYASYDFPAAIAVSPSGNVYVTGTSDVLWKRCATVAYSNSGLPLWTNIETSWTAIGIVVGGNGDVLVGATDHVIKYSEDSAKLWTNLYADVRAIAIAADSAGNAIVAGNYTNDLRNTAYATIKYSTAGVPVWTNRYGPAGSSNFVKGLAVDASGNVFVTGYSLGPGPETNYATVAYSSSGVPLWTNRFGVPYVKSHATALAVGPGGAVYVTGTSGPDYVTIKYVMPRLNTSPTAGNVVKLSWPLVFSDYTLEFSSSLTAGGWQPEPSGPMTNETSNFIMVNPTDAGRFYRLRGQ